MSLRTDFYRAHELSCPECHAPVNLLDASTPDNLIAFMNTPKGVEPVIDPRTLFVACTGCEWACEVADLVTGN